MFGTYTKSITAVVGAVIVWATAVVNSPAADISSSEWIFLAGGLATALGVLALPNKPA